TVTELGPCLFSADLWRRRSTLGPSDSQPAATILQTESASVSAAEVTGRVVPHVRVLVDRQRPMKNVTLDRATVHLLFPPVMRVSNRFFDAAPTLPSLERPRPSITVEIGILFTGKIMAASRRVSSDKRRDAGIPGSPRSHRGCWPARPDLGERWPSRLVATPEEERLAFPLKPAQFQIENDDDRDERDHDCEHEQNGFHIISHPSEKHGVYSLSLYGAPQ